MRWSTDCCGDQYADYGETVEGLAEVILRDANWCFCLAFCLWQRIWERRLSGHFGDRKE
jgi:hypothetical protein